MIKKQVLVFLIFLFCFAFISFAQPPQPSIFYGTIQVNGSDAPVGTIVKPTIGGIEYPSSFTITTAGQYGMLSVNGDDPSTTGTKEGGNNGEIIIFIAKVGETEYWLAPTGFWFSGNTKLLNLTSTGEVPVELSSFNAHVKNNSVDLNWRTESESNNFGFEIQRSTSKINFSKIGFIYGQGTTSQPYSYKYRDTSLPAGKYFYRLKQMDTDGTSTLSQIIEATIFNPSIYKLLQNYPNPFNPNTTITFEIPENENITLDIYDLNGHLVRELLNGFKSAGIHSCTWDGKDKHGRTISNGIYLYRFSSGYFSQTQKMIFAK
ncbi:T9SS type A sorting domain-containing protein [candidate division KSB1 bacterium]|nr:T9SS type A sorting domain-containing protein [candidate division KSB1 bacterium]